MFHFEIKIIKELTESLHLELGERYKAYIFGDGMTIKSKTAYRKF